MLPPLLPSHRTASTTTITYARFGNVQTDYAVALGLVGFVSTVLGQAAFTWLVRRTGRRSLVLMVMLALVGAAMAVLYCNAWQRVLGVLHDPARLWDWGWICPAATSPQDGGDGL